MNNNIDLTRYYRIRDYIAHLIADSLADDDNADVTLLLNDYRAIKTDITAAENDPNTWTNAITEN